MTKRDGICNIRNVGLDMVKLNPATDKERKFLDLFTVINDRYADSCKYHCPSDAFMQELKEQFDAGNGCRWLMLVKRFSFFNSTWYALKCWQEQNDWGEFVNTLFRYGFGIVKE